MLDVLIRNARIVDGSGNPGYKGDLAVQQDRIADIGRFPNAQAELVIDAAGKVLCPGFIRNWRCWPDGTRQACRWASPLNSPVLMGFPLRPCHPSD